MDNIQRHHQVHRKTLPNKNRIPFFDNGLLSDSSDEDYNQGKHLTFVNNINENRPKSLRSQRTPIQYKNQTPFFKNNTKTADRINDTDDVGDSKNDLKIVNNVRPVTSDNFKRSSGFFPNGDKNVDSCSDEDEPPINHLTHINRIQQHSFGKNKVNKLPNDEGNHEEHTNFENESSHWNNLQTNNDTSAHPLYRKWQPESKDNYWLSSTDSTTSTLSFENGSVDEVDDERFVSLTFKNDLKSKNPAGYQNLQTHPSFVSDETKPAASRFFFNNCSDDDEEDHTNFGEFLTCKNKFTPLGQNHLPINKFTNVQTNEQNNDIDRNNPSTETCIQTRDIDDRQPMDQYDNSKRGNVDLAPKQCIATTNDTEIVNASDNQRSGIQKKNTTTISYNRKTEASPSSVQQADTYGHVTEDHRFNDSKTSDTITLSFELKLNTSKTQATTEEGRKGDATSLVKHEKTVTPKAKVCQADFSEFNDDEIQRKIKLNSHPNEEVEKSTTEYMPSMSDFFCKSDVHKSSNNQTLEQENVQSREIKPNNHPLEQRSLQSHETKLNNQSLEQRSLQSQEIKPSNHFLEQESLQRQKIKRNNQSLEKGSLQSQEIRPNNESFGQGSLQSQEIKPNNHSLEQQSLQSQQTKPVMTQYNPFRTTFNSVGLRSEGNVYYCLPCYLLE